MSIPQFLALNVASGTQPLLKLYQGDKVIDIGTSFGGLEVVQNDLAPAQRVVTFLGKLYTFVGGSVYSSYNYGSSWSTVLTPPSINTTAALKNICITYVNGAPNLCIVYRSTDSTETVRLSRSPDGVTWTHSATFSTLSLVGATGTLQSDTVYKNKLYTMGSVSDVIFCSDFGTLAASEGSARFTSIAFAQGEVSLVIFNNRLLANSPSGGTTLALFLIEGVSFVQIASFTLPSSLDANTTQKSAMFVDGANLYVLQYSTTGFWRCVRFTSTFVGTDITSTVLPVAMRQSRSTSRVKCIVDAITDPANPVIYIYYCPLSSWSTNIQNGFIIYRWEGGSTTMRYMGFGGNVSHALPWGTLSQGSAWASNINPSDSNYYFSPYAEITQRTFLDTSIRLEFKLYSQQGGQLVDVNGFYANSTSPYASSPATLANPSHGILSGNTIQGLTVDNGITTYQVTWNSQTDGITTQYFQFIFHVNLQ